MTDTQKPNSAALDALDKAEKYLREILPHDAPSSARKMEILGLFLKIRRELKNEQ